MKLPGRATICEVGTRDGFQIEPDVIPTAQKIDVVGGAGAIPCPTAASRAWPPSRCR